ncbi:hypothetical protein PVAND_002062 [Polypedilum vanderplanki]|uniref:Large ribosomal subunit protein mL64 n=1 Tax=Polypedilum vanderplanki TaxID=319348 RepID=A0A9J6BQD6_POLVA|nr:hypothetical protein PVAND_002062 [Polypedilum vanderplanki]
MFTFKFIKNSLLCGVNLNRNLLVANSRSLQLFRRPNEKKKNEDDDDEDLLPEKIEEQEIQDPEIQYRSIAHMRNKSRLRPAHRNMLYDRVPYMQAESWIHETLKYKRLIYGRYGKASGIDPRICFETKSEMDEREEYERVAFPNTIQEMMVIEEQKKREKKEKNAAREALILANIKKLEQWKTDLTNKRWKKEEEARVAKERKDRLIEEVRRHFGYTIHPKDERFKELLEKKEKEQRKALKEAKKQQKQSKMLEKMAASQKVTATAPAEKVEE